MVFIISVPEIIEAFASPDADFKNKYGFEKPDKSAALVVGCLAGKRAAAAGEQLEKLGFSNFRYGIAIIICNEYHTTYIW